MTVTKPTTTTWRKSGFFVLAILLTVLLFAVSFILYTHSSAGSIFGGSGKRQTFNSTQALIKRSGTAPPVDPSLSIPEFEQCVSAGMFALTFDDGVFEYTSELLDLLDKNSVKASFFINANNYADLTEAPYPSILKRMDQAGHFIGSHTYSHLSLTSLDSAGIFDQMSRNDDVFLSILGKRPTYMRPPYSDSNDAVKSALASFGFKGSVLWNLDSLDATNVNLSNEIDIAKTIFQTALDSSDSASSSFISLMHDPVRTTVEQLVQWAITTVRAKGYRLVAMDECLGVSDQWRK